MAVWSASLCEHSGWWRGGIRAHAAQQIIPGRTLPGLHRLHALPHGFAGELAEIFADRLGHLLPGILFPAWNPNR